MVAKGKRGNNSAAGAPQERGIEAFQALVGGKWHELLAVDEEQVKKAGKKGKQEDLFKHNASDLTEEKCKEVYDDWWAY